MGEKDRPQDDEDAKDTVRGAPDRSRGPSATPAPKADEKKKKK